MRDQAEAAEAWEYDNLLWMPGIYFRGQFWMAAFVDLDAGDGDNIHTGVACLKLPFIIRTLSFLLEDAHDLAWSFHDSLQGKPRKNFTVVAVKIRWDLDSSQYASLDSSHALLDMSACYIRRRRRKGKGPGKGKPGRFGRGRGRFGRGLLV